MYLILPEIDIKDVQKYPVKCIYINVRDFGAALSGCDFFHQTSCQKLYQAEKVRPNKQMSPTRIEIGLISSKCRLQEWR